MRVEPEHRLVAVRRGYAQMQVIVLLIGDQVAEVRWRKQTTRDDRSAPAMQREESFDLPLGGGVIHYERSFVAGCFGAFQPMALGTALP